MYIQIYIYIYLLKQVRAWVEMYLINVSTTWECVCAYQCEIIELFMPIAYVHIQIFEDTSKRVQRDTISLCRAHVWWYYCCTHSNNRRRYSCTWLSSCMRAVCVVTVIKSPVIVIYIHIIHIYYMLVVRQWTCVRMCVLAEYTWITTLATPTLKKVRLFDIDINDNVK